MTERPLTIGVIGTGATVMRAIVGDRKAPILDPLALAAVLSGQYGRAFLCDQEAQRRTSGCPAEKDGTVAHFIVEAPWAHPGWHSYSILVMHLRPMPGIAPPKIHLAGATHELLVHALNPDEPRAPLIRGAARGFAWLEPTNFGAQFIEPTDASALRRVENAVQMVCDGKLSPDTDFNPMWAALFGSNMLKDRA